MLRELLSRWENWNSRTTLVNTLLRGLGDQARDMTDRAIDELPEVYQRDSARRLRRGHRPPGALLGRDLDLYRAVF